MSLIIGVDGAALSTPLTGVGNYIVTLLRALIAARPSAQFIVYSNGPLVVSDLPNVQIRISSPTGRKGPYWQNTQLAAALAGDRPDVFWGGNGLLPIMKPRGMSTVVTVHDHTYKFAGETIQFASRWSRRLMQPLSIRLANKVVAVSHATAAEIRQIYGLRVDDVIEPPINAIFKPAAPSEIDSVRNRYSLPSEYLLSAGTLEPRKNIGALLEAILQLGNRGVRLPLLALVGKNGWLVDELITKIATLEGMGLVRQLGYVPLSDMPALYSGACAFVMPSIYEGFGMPVLEAQLCGTPVLISDIPSLVEASGGHALRFNPTAKGIGAALEDLFVAKGLLPSRPRESIHNSSADAARRMWRVIESSIEGHNLKCPTPGPRH